MGQLRAPARLVLLVDFGLAGLAALGMDALLRQPRRVLGMVAVAVAVALALWLGLAWANLPAAGRPNVAQLATARMALWGTIGLLAAGALVVSLGAMRRLGSPVLAGALLVLVAGDLLVQGIGVDVGTNDPTANYDHLAALAFLQADQSLYRVEVRGESWGDWAPNLSLLQGLYDVGGIYNPLEIADYQLYWESLTDRATPLFDFLNAKYVIGPKDFALPWGKFAPVFDGDPKINIYLNTATQPRVQVVYRSRVLPDSRAQFDALHAPEFDPTREVILASGSALSSDPTGETGLNLAEYEAESIVVDVTAAAEAYVVFSEVDYPGWQATVDDALATIERANFTFRAVRIPPGAHRVALRFAPISWRLGLTISALSLAACVGLFLTGRKKDLSQRREEAKAQRERD
jgi:hypothetical protein